MRHDAPNTPCCLLASEEEQEHDPEMYQGCDTCPVAEHIEGLCGENQTAWREYRQVVTRFTLETQSVALVLDRITTDLDRDAFEDRIERFAVLFDALCPPPESKT